MLEEYGEISDGKMFVNLNDASLKVKAVNKEYTMTPDGTLRQLDTGKTWNLQRDDNISQQEYIRLVGISEVAIDDISHHDNINTEWLRLVNLNDEGTDVNTGVELINSSDEVINSSDDIDNSENPDQESDKPDSDTTEFDQTVNENSPKEIKWEKDFILSYKMEEM